MLSEIKKINKIPEFKNIIEKLILSNPETKNSILNSRDLFFVLIIINIFIKKYEEDKNSKLYVEFAYYLLLKYSLITDNFAPLYDFSINFGFYPISKFLLEDNKIRNESILNEILHSRIDQKYVHNEITETFEQEKVREQVLNSDSKEISLIAPTSYGKSALIIEDIKRNLNNRRFVTIIVPTKSLLMQTYKELKKQNFNQKIIIHDEMYENDEKFISVLTQERAFRLLCKNKELYFDILYIDEAHNLFNKDARNILLSRLIKFNKTRNSSQKVIYLSPLIFDSENLKIEKNQEISEQRIEYNMKEPEIHELRLDLKEYRYNRFANTFIECQSYPDFFSYLLDKKSSKNFIYLYRPIMIESFSKNLFSKMISDNQEINSEIQEIIQNLKKYVHDDFYEIEYLKKGIVYLHGKLPDGIKEYLEYKFKTVKAISYIIANHVVLEGINFPVETLFILNTYGLKPKKLINLIGRVNRLNTIFDLKTESRYKLLLPKIHFLNTVEYGKKNSNMSTLIMELRKDKHHDELVNPTLENFDIDKFKEKEKEKISQIIEDENFVLSDQRSLEGLLKKKMLELSMNSIYTMSKELFEELIKRINIVKNETFIDEKNIMEYIRKIFIVDLDNHIIDSEIRRLKYKEACFYYKNFLENSKNKSLKQNIENIFNHFTTKKNSQDSNLYIGTSFSEVNKNGYVDLKDKNKKELVNLAIIKFKIESDFISYKLSKFFELMLENGLITMECYNKLFYGTNDDKKLTFMRLGLTINIINKLDNENQIDNISLNKNNTLVGNKEFNDYRNSLDDFLKFELDKFIEVSNL